MVAHIDLHTLDNSLRTCESANAAHDVLDNILRRKETGDDSSRLYNSKFIPPGSSCKSLSDAELAIQTKIRNSKYGIMELIELNGDRDADRASLALLGIFVGSSGTALVANQNLPGPEILRFLVVWLLSFAPLAFVGYGIASAESLQAVLLSVQRTFFPTYRKRMIQHEAGHFLMGHLLGVPVKEYKANSVKNAVEFFPLNDQQAGRNMATVLGFDAQASIDGTRERSSSPAYFSEQGRGATTVSDQSVFRPSKKYRDNRFLKLPSINDPTEAWPYRGFSDDMMDRLTVVSVAGVCAEILAFGNAEGGYADFSQLRQLFNSAETELDEREMENRVRFALGYTMSQLRLHLGVLDTLAAVMENGGTVGECICAIETCSNVSGQEGILGDYEHRRRDAFRSDGVGLLEKLLLNEKSADTEATEFVEGKGGGYKREQFALTGDDPLYVAVFAAASFFIWASCGGLSLH